ncbi:helix-turn-helix domain-containing protein [Streptomyces ziwulingensis]|uniref:HTH tetR-type domain-containing protein n=1 Tax=Streptomyces ziwulingensis TaxID=1045501 RepID=A0ABP9CVT9_9ACTN
MASASSDSRAVGAQGPSVVGRPRDTSRGPAILEATLSLLTEVGYEHLSMEAVAGRSGAAKTTIYRRYRDKAALVVAAVEHRTQGGWSRCSPQATAAAADEGTTGR